MSSRLTDREFIDAFKTYPSVDAMAKAHPTYIRHGSSNRYWRLGEATDTA